MAKIVTFRRGTTPTLRVRQGSGIQISKIATLRFTLEMGSVEITKEVSSDDFKDPTYVDFKYTQDETLSFPVGTGKMQCKAELFDGNVVGGDIGTFKVTEILDENIFDLED